MKQSKNIKITIYRWAGSWGPFSVKIPCGECTLTLDIINDVVKSDLSDIPTEIIIRDWLSEWWKPFFKRGFYAPIVMVQNKVIAQGSALNRGVLVESVVQEYLKISKVKGTVIYGKETCPHCKRAKAYLDEAQIDYTYFDVIASPRALYEMIPRVKSHIGEKSPVTVPQIWLDGNYIGGADQLNQFLEKPGS